jgi:2-polyprenyl-6-methoxyphenol hydroxylase-like FAD-dependent oxidoreductase
MKEHGVIIGGGIAGLLAAHVLADRFKLVTILERDQYPHQTRSSAPLTRRGAPQSRCLHLLTAAGAAVFDKLMPSWSKDIVANGGIPFDASADTALRLSEGWLPRNPSGIITYACSRSLVEYVLRCGLAKKPNVRIREGQKVLGLLSRPPDRGVTEVQVANPQHAGEATIFADLVVDSSGAGSSLPYWIGRLRDGAESPVTQTVVDSKTAYVSRWFHLEPTEAPDWCCLSAAPTREAPYRAAIMLRAEEDRWGVALLAFDGSSLPADDEGFLDFAAGLCDGELHKVLARATPVSPIYHYGRCSNRVMHYDRLRAWPDGLIALGDSVCVLDPYFGLGMTAAARGAVLLGTHLDRNGAEPVSTQSFQKDLALLNAAPWQLATCRDLDGRPLSNDRARLRHLYQMAPTSCEAAHTLLAVQHMLLPAQALTEIDSA